MTTLSKHIPSNQANQPTSITLQWNKKTRHENRKNNEQGTQAVCSHLLDIHTCSQIDRQTKLNGREGTLPYEACMCRGPPCEGGPAGPALHPARDIPARSTCNPSRRAHPVLCAHSRPHFQAAVGTEAAGHLPARGGGTSPPGRGATTPPPECSGQAQGSRQARAGQDWREPGYSALRWLWVVLRVKQGGWDEVGCLDDCDDCGETGRLNDCDEVGCLNDCEEAGKLNDCDDFNDVIKAADDLLLPRPYRRLFFFNDFDFFLCSCPAFITT